MSYRVKGILTGIANVIQKRVDSAKAKGRDGPKIQQAMMSGKIHAYLECLDLVRGRIKSEEEIELEGAKHECGNHPRNPTSTVL